MDWRSLTAIHFRTISHILRTILALNTIVFSQIIKSQKGNIWCITYNNLLYLFDTRTEKFRNVFFGYPHLAGYEEVARIYKQTGGILWFSNKAGELFRIDEERLGEADGIVHLPCRSCAGHGQKIYTVYQDKRGYEWILTEQGTFVYNHPEIQTDVRLRYVKEADKSTYFLTEGGELYTFGAGCRDSAYPESFSNEAGQWIGFYKIRQIVDSGFGESDCL